MERVYSVPPLVTLRQRWLRGRALPRWARRTALVLLAGTVVVAGFIVLDPVPPAEAGQTVLHDWSAIWRIGGLQPTFLTFDTVEWLSNVVMFLPIGFLYAGVVHPRNRYRVVPVAAAASIGVETVQLFIPDRVSSVSDVVANTLGALIGVLLLVAASERFRR